MLAFAKKCVRICSVRIKHGSTILHCLKKVPKKGVKEGTLASRSLQRRSREPAWKVSLEYVFIFVHLLGLREGIFGRCRAAHGVTEAQGRGHLHMHVLLWTVHGPLFFARFLHDAEKRNRLIKRINVLVTAQLAKDGKITSRHKCRDPPPLAPRPASPPALVDATDAAVTLSNNGDEAAPENPPPTANAAGPWNPESPFPERPRNLEEARAAASSSGARHLLHACCKRCRKPPKGHIMCAMAFSRPPAEHTTIDQCHLCDSDPKVPVTDRALCVEDGIDPPPSEEVPAGMPVSPLDTRLLCTRLQRIHLQDCFTSLFRSARMVNLMKVFPFSGRRLCAGAWSGSPHGCW